MKIEEFLKKFDVDRKCFLLLTVAAKGKYPTSSYGEDYDQFVNSLLRQKNSYIGIFDHKRDEILQDVAFKLLTMPLITDRNEDKLKRANDDLVKSFFILKNFYETVPSGKLKEDEAIQKGLELGVEFLEKYPLDTYEMTVTKHSKHEDGCQILKDIKFTKNNSEFYFDKIYAI